jgi:hypothetical protein
MERCRIISAIASKSSRVTLTDIRLVLSRFKIDTILRAFMS